MLIALVMFATIGFSSKAIFIKFIFAEQVSVEITMLYRMLMSLPLYFLILIVQLRRSTDALPVSINEYLKMGGVGVLGYYFASFFDLKGLETVSVNLERMILYLYPSIIFLVLVLLGKKKIHWVSVAALGVAYLGIGITFLSDAQGSNSYSLRGMIFVFLSALSFAFYVMGSEKYAIRFGSIRYTCFAMMGASVAIFSHFFVVYGFTVPSISSHVAGLILGMAVLSTVVPSLCFSVGVKYLGALEVGVVGMIGPIAAAIMSNYFLGEAFTVFHLLGLLLVLAGAAGLAFFPAKS